MNSATVSLTDEKKDQMALFFFDKVICLPSRNYVDPAQGYLKKAVSTFRQGEDCSA